ncbi:MAG TPA: SPW repeat protein [Nitrospiraceae bacterium]|nr:SPW repeat protein [Nitrospiraceae bacterium]
MKYLPWIIGVLAMWLISAPFLLGYEETPSAMRNDVAVGLLILIGTFVWGWTELRGKTLNFTIQGRRRN